MMSADFRNDFLLDLLALQQDGKSAISAPSNWSTETPLLEVETEVDGIVDDLQSAIRRGSHGKHTARWHFFIGSPGNGKSAAMGKLCRKLLLAGDCHVRDETGTSIQNLDPSVIPYAINVYEGDNKFASAQIVQDASVVRNPFSPEVDPAKELLETIRDAWEKGISLIVCTNRGVLEKAHRDNHMDHGINSKPWFKILAAVVSAKTSMYGELPGALEFDSKKPVFADVHVTFSHMDSRSLLLGKDTFDRLFQKAADAANWSSCGPCPSHQFCPFKANRDWLADAELRARVLSLLSRAEVFSGQVIVFREALAIVSLILAGCPRDYDSAHPCEWVRNKARDGDIFSLAARRIYMCLFASYCPYGLEVSDPLRRRQQNGLRSLYEIINSNESEALAALKNVIGTHAPSTDVGAARLLGRDGVIASLDPCREALPPEFYERWDSDFETMSQHNPLVAGSLEQACLSIWATLELGLEFAAVHSATEAHWALRRWSSNFLMHLGVLVEGRSAWKDGLDSFTALLELVGRAPEHRSLEEKRRIRELDKELGKILDAASNETAEGSIPLSDTVALAGEWVKEKLKPRTIAREESGSVALAIEFGEGEGAEQSIFAALMYLWLTRRAAGKLDLRCFPPELLSGAIDARVRAAARGKYAFADNDIEMLVDTGREKFRITRLDGEVDVRHE